MSTNNNKPARRERNLKSVDGTPDSKPKKERKPRAAGGDFDAEFAALADKHRKRTSKLRGEVEKLERKLGEKRALLDKAEAPLRKVERALEARDPSFAEEALDEHDDGAAMKSIAERPNAEGTPPEYASA